MSQKINEYPIAIRYLTRLLLAFAILAALIITKTLLVPLFLSILFAYLLYPAAHKLESHGVPRIVTNLILIIGSILVIAGVIYLIILLTVSLTTNFSTLEEHFQTNITHFRWALGRTFGVTAAQLDSMVASIKGSGEYIQKLFKITANGVLVIGLLPVYTFLILFYRDKFRNFVSMLVSSDQEDSAQSIIDQAADVVPRYLKGLFIVFLILVGINSLGFYIFGIKYALLLGFIAAFFNLIPYLGTIIGYGIAFLFVFATQSPSAALTVALQFFVVQFLENNILTPNITGSYVQINPLVTILSIIAGGMIWGLPGMFMVIPYLALLKIICENIEEFKPVGYLLGTRGTERYQISIQAIKDKFGWHK